MKNHIKVELEKNLKNTLNKLYSVLEDKPRIAGDHDGNKSSHIQKDVIELVYKDETIKLKQEGRIYDYVVLAPEKYQAPTTREQIDSIIDEKGKQPSMIRYTLCHDFYDSKIADVGLRLEYKVAKGFDDEEVQKRLGYKDD